jgi:proteasome alpha subunit
VFTHEMKPYEVELLVVEVGRADDDHAEMYHLFYDGVVIDERRFAVLGGQTEQITEALESQYTDGMALGDALKLGAKVLGTEGDSLDADQLEVALLDRSRPRRAFRRIKNAELEQLLA